MAGCGLDWSGPGWAPLVGCHENGNEPLGLINCWTFLY